LLFQRSYMNPGAGGWIRAMFAWLTTPSTSTSTLPAAVTSRVDGVGVVALAWVAAIVVAASVGTSARAALVGALGAAAVAAPSG
jgi:hypothetical protein